MKHTLSALAMLLLGAALLRAQETLPATSTPTHADFDINDLNGIPLHGEAGGVEGLDYTSAISVTVWQGHSELHHIIIDRNHKLYFGSRS